MSGSEKSQAWEQKSKWTASVNMPTGQRACTSLSPRALTLHPICLDCPTSLVNENVVSTYSFFSLDVYFQLFFCLLSAQQLGKLHVVFPSLFCNPFSQWDRNQSWLGASVKAAVPFDTKTNTENQSWHPSVTKAGLKYFAMGEKSNFA